MYDLHDGVNIVHLFCCDECVNLEVSQIPIGDIMNHVAAFHNYIQMVSTIVERLSHSHRAYDINEMTQQGCLGLMQAIEMYSPCVGMGFEIYAQMCIQENIIRGNGIAQEHKR